MATTLLHVDCSPMGETSISRALTREYARRWRGAHPQGRIVARDLATTSIPPLDAAWIAASYAPEAERSPAQHALLAQSTELVAELVAADDVVIGMPMHNWGPPATMKLWADQLVRFGVTIASTPQGLRGMLGGKRVTCIVTAGRHFEAHAGRNHVEPWLRTFFGNLGAAVSIIFADGTADVRHHRIERAEFLARHVEAIASLLA
jgi:FMN-dependent NADH-azoreductase